MNIKTSVLIIFIIGILSCVFYKSLYSQSPEKATIDIITKNILNQYARNRNVMKLNDDVIKWSNFLSDEGSWPDLNYDTRSRASWDPGNHFLRVRLMAEAYMLNSDSPQLYQKIEKAIFFWINRRPEPQSDNWYYETISIPRDVGYILLFMQHSPKQLPESAVNGLLTWMKKSRKIETQASTELGRMLAIGLHYILRGCVTKDEFLIKQAVSYVNQMMEPDSGYTGIQADYSFHAHGKQLYSHGYGVSMLERFADFAEILKGTPFEFSGNNAQRLYKFSHSAFFNLARGQYLDYNVAGRNIARTNNLQAKRLIPLLKTYQNLDSARFAEQYEAAIARFSGKRTVNYKMDPEHLHFWSSDYSAHIRPGYFAGLRMSSTRVVKPERGNGENILEHFRGNGAMSVMVRGNEYYNIFPVWKWNQIPGTTVPALQDLSGQDDWFFNYGKTDFVGGVSDGKYGTSVYLMDDYETHAKKSWFFFDRQIVCLGAGINSQNDAPIYTTINQSISNGGVEIETSKGVIVYNDDSAWSDVKLSAIKNDEVGYSFPGGETVQMSNGIQTGSWNRININLPKDTVKERVFKLHIDHGIQPKSSSYSYVIWPGISSIKDIQPGEVSILKNNENVQAVYNKNKDMCQAVFYEAGDLDIGKTKLRVNKPCLIIVKDVSGKSPMITVSDPTQKLKEIEIQLDRGEINGQKFWSCTLPDGKMSGKSVRVN